MLRILFEKFTFALFFLVFLGFCGGLTVYGVVSRDLPQLPDNLEKLNLSLPTEIYSADGKIIKILGHQRPISFAEISPNFLNAIISVEDARFYRHNGLDHRALLRALYINLKRKRIIQGGSTITQQLSKNLFFSFERNWIRKIKELLIALQIEASFSKDEILEAYSNQIYFGNGAYGIEEASQLYFGRPARTLSVLQGAMLAGIPYSPNEANPFASIDRALTRAYYVLDRMMEEGYITSKNKKEAIQSDISISIPKKRKSPNLYFADLVLEQLEKKYGKEFVYFGGIKVFTTLNANMQEFAQKAVNTHLKYLEPKLRYLEEDPREPLQAALVSIENQTGAVRAMLGGRDYSASQFNRAISNNRSPGSSFKPIVYLTAMELFGYHPGSIVKDEPRIFEIPGVGIWEPKNFEDKYLGQTVLKKALMQSANLVSAQLVHQVSPQKVIQTARQFGVQSSLGPHYSLALGTSPVSPLEMTSVYSVIANLGFLNRPYFIQKIEDFNGNILYEHFFRGVQRFPRKSIYPLLDMMRGVIEGGTGNIVRRMKFDYPVAGKTGTTNNYKDAWFTAFTKDLSTSVWVGRDDNKSMIMKTNRGLTGSRGAAPIWVFFMKQALKGKTRVDFPVPEGIKFVHLDPQTGIPEDPAKSNTLRVAVHEEVEFTQHAKPINALESKELMNNDSSLAAPGKTEILTQ